MSKHGFDKLRIKAEEQLAAKDQNIADMGRADLKTLTHELAVHQIELEIQNEELRQARTAAEEIRDRYVDLYDFAPVGYFGLDGHSRIIEANLTGCRLLGVDKRNIKNKPFTRFVAENESDKFYLYRKNILEHNSKLNAILIMKKVDGTIFHAQLESIKTGDERLRIVVSDVTEREQAKIEVSHLASFPELNPDPVVELDFSANLIYANPAAKTRFQDLMQMGSSHPFLRDIANIIPQVGTKSITRDISVGTSWYAQTLTFITSTKTCRIYARDITARNKAEDDLKQRTFEVETINKELEAFSYSVSHDLRAPLRRMAGFSTALIEDYAEKLDEQGKQYLRNIEDSSALMARLIDDLLKLARVTRSDINYEKVDLSGMAQKVVDELARTEPKRKVEVSILPDITAYGDRTLLRQVLENLLGNAWKYSSKIAEANIEMGTTDRNGKLVYFIRDNGVGFDIAYADKLFKPFQRLHHESEFAGTGIGLAIVQRIIRRHGGEIWVESKVGEGATFYFTLN